MESLFACSGLGGFMLIGENIRIGYIHAAVNGVLLLASLAVATFTRQWAVPALLLGMLVLHPAWTVSAINGDCGSMKREAAGMFTGLGGMALVWQVARGPWLRGFTSLFRTLLNNPGQAPVPPCSSRKGQST